MNANTPAESGHIVFFLDVDNTLLDNDRLKAEMEARLLAAVGPERARSFWEIYEKVRESEDYVDIPATASEFERRYTDINRAEVDHAVLDVRFANYLYPGALEALRYLDTIGTTVILSDGDPVFQKKKIADSGVAQAAGGRVILTVHKQKEMGRAFAAYPAGRYVMIDDKTVILADLKREYPDRLTTVLVQQGKYSHMPAEPPADVVVEAIGDIVGMAQEAFTRATAAAPPR